MKKMILYFFLGFSIFVGKTALALTPVDLQGNYVPRAPAQLAETGNYGFCDQVFIGMNASFVTPEQILVKCQGQDPSTCDVELWERSDSNKFVFFQGTSSYEQMPIVAKNVWTDTQAMNQQTWGPYNGEVLNIQMDLTQQASGLVFNFNCHDIVNGQDSGSLIYSQSLKANLNPQLFQAIESKNISQVQSLLQQGADPSAVDYNHDYRSAAFTAIDQDSLDILKILLNAGADTSSLLNEAALVNANDIFNFLMQLKWTQDDLTWSLESIISSGHIEYLQSVLNAGAKPTDYHLGKAAHVSRADMIALLLKAGAVVDQYSPPSLAIAANNDCIDCANELLAAGANPNLQIADYFNETSLMYAAGRGFIDMVNLLLTRGAKMDLMNSYGDTAVGYAINEDKAAALSVLVKAGANLNYLTQTQMSPLMIAASFGNADCVSILLSANVDTCVQGVDGKTAAQIATESGFSDIATSINAKKSCQ